VLEELALTQVYLKRLESLSAHDDSAVRALQQLALGTGPVSAARELLQAMEPNSPVLRPELAQKVRGIAAEEFQRQQQERRLQKMATACLHAGLPPCWAAACARTCRR